MLSHRLRAMRRGGCAYDIYTKTMLHMDGVNGSTTFIDEMGKTVTAYGNAQITTAASKFGGASGLFDGTGDYLSIPDSADWQLDDGNTANAWSIDTWVMFDDVTLNRGFVGQGEDSSNWWGFIWNQTTGNLRFRVASGGTNIVDVNNSWSPSINVWYHIAIGKDSSANYRMFVGGTQIGTTANDTSTIPNFAAVLKIGDANGNMMNGKIDELRIRKGIAYTSNFTPPTAAYC